MAFRQYAKWLNTEVKAQEKSISIGTSSGLEKKIKTTTSSFLNSSKGAAFANSVIT